jgi:hypothetical protein
MVTKNYEYRKETALLPSLIKKVQKLRADIGDSVKISYRFRQYTYDRRFFVTVLCEPTRRRVVSSDVRRIFTEARCTSAKVLEDGSMQMVFSTMM